MSTTDIATPQPPTGTDAPAPLWLRAIVALAALLATAALVYFWKYVLGMTNPKGGGMELVALVPATALYLLTGLPALVMTFTKRTVWSMRAALIMLAIGAVLGFVYYNQIVSEFAQYAR